MRRLLPTILVALSAVQVPIALAQSTPACVPTCSTQVRDEFSTFSCPTADDAACLCASANFYYGIRDCSSTGCGATDVEVYDYLSAAGNFCQGQALPVSPTSALSAATSTITGVTTQDSGTVTPMPTSASVEASTTPETTPETSSVPTATQETVPETSSQTSTAVPLATPDSTSSESTPTESTPTATSATGTTSAAASETSSAHAAPASSALSQATVIGIGVGVGAGVIAIASVAIFLLLRNRKQGARQSVDASNPRPSSGRAYPTRDHGSFEKYANDIEMVSNRYEDMVPRQKPRTMV